MFWKVCVETRIRRVARSIYRRKVLRRRLIYSPGLCGVRRAACVVKSRLFAVFWNNPENLQRGVNRFVSHSGGQRVLCVFLPNLPDQSERVAACQTPKQSSVQINNKCLQIPTLCSNFLFSDSSSQALFGTSARRTEHQVSPLSSCSEAGLRPKSSI
jgi:hypothetical protein